MTEEQGEKEELNLGKVLEQQANPKEFFSEMERIDYFEDIADKLRHFQAYKQALNQYDGLQVLQKSVIRDSHLKLSNAIEAQADRLSNQRTKDYTAAVDAYERCLQIRLEQFDKGCHWSIARAIFKQGLTLMKQDKHRNAQNKFETALQMREKLLDERPSASLALVYLALCRCFLKQEQSLNEEKAKDRTDFRNKAINRIKTAMQMLLRLQATMQSPQDLIEVQQTLDECQAVLQKDMFPMSLKNYEQFVSDVKAEFDASFAKEEVLIEIEKAKFHLLRQNSLTAVHLLTHAEYGIAQMYGENSTEYIEKLIQNGILLKDCGYQLARAHAFKPANEIFVQSIEKLKQCLQLCLQRENFTKHSKQINAELTQLEKFSSQAQREEAFFTDEEIEWQKQRALMMEQKRQEEIQRKIKEEAERVERERLEAERKAKEDAGEELNNES